MKLLDISKNNSKTLNFKIDKKLLEKTNYYRGVEPNGALSQIDYVKKALEEKNQKTKALRSGHEYIKVLNPYTFCDLKDKEEDVLNILTECLNKLSEINPILSFGIDEVLVYCKKLFYDVTKKERELFIKNKQDDIKFENEL